MLKKDLYHIKSNTTAFKVNNKNTKYNLSLVIIRRKPQILLLSKNFNLVHIPIYVFKKL
ncbi:hypothetical protein K502DRAFT_369170 [Neoconidiobolus thromboides FSU 785]|nr:hypothetical protein K502DRAFT_369170 [Neoconidiobolus thromboides FSU 785]